MGAPVLEQLTPMESKAVSAFLGNGGNKTAACREAGYSDPHAQSPTVFGRPRIRALLPHNTLQKAATRLGESLDAPKWSDKLRGIELIAKLTGELNDNPSGSIQPITTNILIFNGESGTLPRSEDKEPS